MFVKHGVLPCQLYAFPFLVKWAKGEFFQALIWLDRHRHLPTISYVDCHSNGRIKDKEIYSLFVQENKTFKTVSGSSWTEHVRTRTRRNKNEQVWTKGIKNKADFLTNGQICKHQQSPEVCRALQLKLHLKMVKGWESSLETWCHCGDCTKPRINSNTRPLKEQCSYDMDPC